MVAFAVGGGVLYFQQPTSQNPSIVREVKVDVPLRQVNEEVFDNNDNLFVLFLDGEEELTERQEDIKKLVSRLKAEPSMHRVTYYYNVRKEGDPAVPDGSGPAEEQGAASPVKCVMYKGQRKDVMRVSPDAVQVDAITEFFTAKTEKLKKEMRELVVARVSEDTFAEDVVEGSTIDRPILLQMYEDTCFLCFLMRPFINSIAKMFQEAGVPLRIKRLNIEKNDFPDRCPVARGTPTFVLFCGTEREGHKWDEFKPKELVERISTDFAQFLPDSVLDKMDEYQGLVSKRFQLFTQLVMWTIELNKLEAIITATPSGAGAGQPAEGGDEEENTFSSLVSEMMLKDMKRTDMLLENIEYLQNEIDDVEHDATLLGITLAERVMAGEKAEEDALRKGAGRWRR